jgi:hypothetical protein
MAMSYPLEVSGTFFEGVRQLRVEAATLSELCEGVRRACGITLPAACGGGMLHFLVMDPDFGELCVLDDIAHLLPVSARVGGGGVCALTWALCAVLGGEGVTSRCTLHNPTPVSSITKGVRGGREKGVVCAHSRSNHGGEWAG